jgi:hypothetical protein
MRRISLGEHWYDNVDHESFFQVDFVDNLLNNLHRDCVMAVGVDIRLPRVGRTHKVLVLDVDKVFGISDVLYLVSRAHKSAVFEAHACDVYFNSS